MPPERRPINKLYIPSYPLELFNIQRAPFEGKKVRGTQNVTLITGDRKDLDIGGLDFSLATAAVSGASKHILEFDGLKTNFVVITDHEEDKAKWKSDFVELTKSEEGLTRALNFRPDSPENVEKLKVQLRKSNLMILPLKPGSPLFGSEALPAIAAGVPVLVSSHSGIASLLETLHQDESITRESTLDSDVNQWRDRILQKLLRPEDSR